MTATSSAWARHLVALVPARLFAAAGFVAADRPTSWIGPHLSGYLASPCYVLRSGPSALMVDTGLAAHWGTICSGLDGALAGTTARSLIMTRREPDAIGNLPGIVSRFDLGAVYCGGVINPLDFFERVDAVSTATHLRAIADVDVTWIKPGADLPIGELRLEVLPTTLRVLPKNHLYERQSRTLFASDTWGFVPQASADGLDIVRDGDERLSVSAIARHFLHRFEWLAGVDTAPMQEEINTLSAYPIERICSSYGCVIEGRALVDAVLRDTKQALRTLSGMDRIPRMNGRVRNRIAAANAGSMDRMRAGGQP